MCSGWKRTFRFGHVHSSAEGLREPLEGLTLSGNCVAFGADFRGPVGREGHHPG